MGLFLPNRALIVIGAGGRIFFWKLEIVDRDWQGLMTLLYVSFRIINNYCLFNVQPYPS
jgi:hypothetical protein